MEIRGVGGINPLDQSGSNAQKPARAAAPSASADSLSLSPQAATQREEAFLRGIAEKLTKVDEARIAEVKERLSSGYYDKKEVLDVLTDRMIRALGL